jgi:hypothetical protein
MRFQIKKSDFGSGQFLGGDKKLGEKYKKNKLQCAAYSQWQSKVLYRCANTINIVFTSYAQRFFSCSSQSKKPGFCSSSSHLPSGATLGMA